MIYVVPTHLQLLPFDEAEEIYRESLAADVLDDSGAMGAVRVMLGAAAQIMKWVVANEEEPLAQAFLLAVANEDADARRGAVVGIAGHIGGNAAKFFLGYIPHRDPWPDRFEFFECVGKRLS